MGTTNKFLAAGTRVTYNGTGKPEYGVIVHCWHNWEIDAYDCYVAFFGDAIPDAMPAEKPYVLRYAATSLTVLD